MNSGMSALRTSSVPRLCDPLGDGLSARAVVASEPASAIRASNFTTMCFMVVRQLPQITPNHFLLGEAQKL